ncbi:MAG: DUF4252 domain-containing protein [Cyclobacteriaceae bacterium]|nr:DUF4252 domain-containing protein [Cyclobacteriaceae bacterium]
MKQVLFILSFAICIPAVKVFGQTQTTTELHERYNDALSLYFYKNTLRMLNQTENKEFDEMIKDIEKMKFLVIDKEEDFGSADYKALLNNYKGELYEEIMTSRFQGKNFDVLLKERSGVTKGMIVLANDSSNLYVLDILGKIELDKVTQLFSTIDDSAEISKMIKAFSDDDHDDRDRLRRMNRN